MIYYFSRLVKGSSLLLTHQYSRSGQAHPDRLPFTHKFTVRGIDNGLWGRGYGVIIATSVSLIRIYAGFRINHGDRGGKLLRIIHLKGVTLKEADKSIRIPLCFKYDSSGS